MCLSRLPEKKGRFTYIPKNCSTTGFMMEPLPKACLKNQEKTQGRTGDVREVLAGAGGEASDAFL